MLGGYGINIVSTSKGLMSGKAARRRTSAESCWPKFTKNWIQIADCRLAHSNAIAIAIGNRK